MSKKEFMFDYSLEYIVYMINKYIEDNYSQGEQQPKEDEEVKEMNFSKMF
jgi:hypothetical protein